MSRPPWNGRHGRLWLAAASGLLLVASCLGSCMGTTGGEVFEFEAYAAGPERAATGPYAFENDRGWAITLTRARLHVGAVYLNRSRPTSVSSDTSCTLPGIYVAELTEGLEVDVLDPTPVPFPGLGRATTDRALTAEVWLTGGDISASSDPTVVARVEGEATRGDETVSFSGEITIGENRAEPVEDPVQPGRSPICKKRVVSPISVDVVPTPGEALVLRVDPAGWFGNVEFSELEGAESGSAVFRDDDGDAPSRSFFAGVRANSGVYEFDWIDGIVR